ncbi:MAG: hypothetical protein ACTSR8_00855 [Promethearchaeota archaeon]
MHNPEKGNNKLIVELKPCSRCKNPFMVKIGDIKPEQEIICNNCLKLEERKRELSISVIDQALENNNQMETCIKEMKNSLTVSKGQFNKQAFLEKIKQRSQALTKSLELLQKIDESQDEQFLEEYKKLFEQMKKSIK